MEASCPFCERVRDGDLLAENQLAVAFADAFPVSLGHSLVVPRRHEADLFNLPQDDLVAVGDLLLRVREILAQGHSPEGFNVGVNSGEVAGQTVPHAHVHLIPRYRGDLEDPRGGVRWVLPERAAYWEG